jgi:hypothetical protein
VASVWAWQTALAAAASWPVASLARTAYGASPRGDSPLWDPGGHALLDFLWHGASALAPVSAAAEVALVVGAIAGIVPMTAMMVAMAHVGGDRDSARFVPCMANALRVAPSLLVLLVLVGAGQAATVGIGAAVGSGIATWAHSAIGEVRAERMGIAVGLVFVALASGLGVVHDLARAQVVRSQSKALRALALAARAFGGAPLPLWWAWAWRATLSLGLVLIGATVAGRIGGRGGQALVLLTVLHQTVVVSRVAFRASWLACALRSVDGPAGAR